MKMMEMRILMMNTIKHHTGEKNFFVDKLNLNPIIAKYYTKQTTEFID